MRQLKGKVKENAREKRERKKEFMENKEKAFSIGKRIRNTFSLEKYR
jgi:protein subunit release factor B